MGLFCFRGDLTLSRFLDGELPLAGHRRVQEHLRRCPRCRRRLDDFRRVDLAVAGLAGAVPGRPIPARLAMAAAAAALLASLAANLALEVAPRPPGLRVPGAPARTLDRLYSRLSEPGAVRR